MKNYLLAAGLLLGYGLASCSDPAQDYLQERNAAAKLPPAQRLGFNLRLGASRQQVARSLDSLHRHKALQVRALVGEDRVRVPLKPIPLFAHNKLVGLRLEMPAGPITKPLVVSLLDSMRWVYGNGEQEYRPATDDWYWFSGGTEIDYGFSTTCNCHRVAYTTLSAKVQQPVR
jgi:hypothetical protein